MLRHADESSEKESEHMTFFETVGFVWIVLMACCGQGLVLWAALKHLTRVKDLALRGEVEQIRDGLRAVEEQMIGGLK